MNTKRMIVAALLAAGTSAANAIPSLQVGIVGGTYDNSPGVETTIAGATPFTLYALLTPQQNATPAEITALLNTTYYMSFALTPKLNPPDASATLGSFDVDGTTYNVTGDMIYGTPPLETVATQLFDSGDLSTHGIYETWFKQLSFNFSGTDQTTPFNVQPGADGCEGCDPAASGGTGAFFKTFTVDVSLLEAGYSIHMDLYNEKVITCGRNPNCVAGDVDVNDFAPFSHDAQSGTHDNGGGGGPVSGVPEIDAVAGTGALTLLAGAMVLAGERRRRKTS